MLNSVGSLTELSIISDARSADLSLIVKYVAKLLSGMQDFLLDSLIGESGCYFFWTAVAVRLSTVLYAGLGVAISESFHLLAELNCFQCSAVLSIFDCN